jgi:hypothetical protein
VLAPFGLIAPWRRKWPTSLTKTTGEQLYPTAKSGVPAAATVFRMIVRVLCFARAQHKPSNTQKTIP